MQSLQKFVSKCHPVLQCFVRENIDSFELETLKSYSLVNHNFLTYINKSDLNEITTANVFEWLGSLKHEGKKNRSLIQYLSSLNSFYGYCVEEEVIQNNPCYGILKLKTPKLMPRPLSESSLFKLKEASLDNYRDRTIIETLYTTGVRVSELVSILIEDINFDNHEIRIRKGKNCQERYVLFSFDCGERLKKYLAQREDTSPYLIINHHQHQFTSRGIWWLIKQYVKKAGLDQTISPHSLRHTMACHLAEKGVEFDIIAELLGHKDLDNINNYAKLTPERRKRIYDEFY